MSTIRRENTRHRQLVLARDRGICALCGRDTLRLQAWLLSIPVLTSLGQWAYGRADKHTKPNFARVLGRHRARAVALLGRLWGTPIPSAKTSLWAMDHDLPVAEGGGECGLENLRSLCLRCHQAETTALAGRLARRTEKGIGRGSR